VSLQENNEDPYMDLKNLNSIFKCLEEDQL